MSSSDKSGASFGGTQTAESDPPAIEMPSRSGADKKGAIGADTIVAKRPDYDDKKFKQRWNKIIARQREELDIDVLGITRPRAKLDPIAEDALNVLCSTLLKADGQSGLGHTAGPISNDNLEKKVRDIIIATGTASEVKRVTHLLNSQHMSDGRRWVLYATYVYLLNRLFSENTGHKKSAKDLERVMGDDVGVSEKILLDLEADGGPIDVFTRLIVKSVMDKNRIDESETLRDIVSLQIRSTI